jgi:hypothetical protein
MAEHHEMRALKDPKSGRNQAVEENERGPTGIHR